MDWEKEYTVRIEKNLLSDAAHLNLLHESEIVDSLDATRPRHAVEGFLKNQHFVPIPSAIPRKKEAYPLAAFLREGIDSLDDPLSSVHVGSVLTLRVDLHR